MYQVGTVRRFYDGYQCKTLPGILLCAILAIPCWLLGQHFHFIGSPIFAIILGIIIGSLFTSWKREKTGAGIGFTSKKILQWAVILLGFGLNITQVLHVGWVSLTNYHLNHCHIAYHFLHHIQSHAYRF